MGLLERFDEMAEELAALKETVETNNRGRANGRVGTLVFCRYGWDLWFKIEHLRS